MSTFQKEDLFELPIEYKGQEQLLSARLVQMGYTWKIYIMVQEEEIIFEPDEERNFRAVMEGGFTNRNIPVELIEVIAVTLQHHFG